VEVRKDKFSVAMVPHTLLRTTIASKIRGDHVNIEYDILSKYVESLLPQKT
jgi:riboflavin synthase